jgi:ornithine cyclodeaminase/alanine dehydrogenase-like protein (mu-crystallin family)
MISLNELDVQALGVPAEIIAVIREAFTRDYHKTLHMPLRTQLPMADNGVLLIMPAFDSELEMAGVKTVTVTAGNGVHAHYELMDGVSGEVVARMQARWLTDLRTAATTAVATDLLAPPDVTTLGIFGTGRQATAHIALLPLIRRFKRVLVCGSGKSDVEWFAKSVGATVQVHVEAATAEKCARESDVICTCTTSHEPVFRGEWLRPGTHINLIGAFQPHTRECDDETVRSARIVVDTYEGAMAEAGDILLPLQSGALKREQIVADLHELASGKRQGRTSPEDITVFKSVGCALEDLVTAHWIYQRAKH